jgi:SAM-dependent methyltransferase
VGYVLPLALVKICLIVNSEILMGQVKNSDVVKIPLRKARSLGRRLAAYPRRGLARARARVGRGLALPPARYIHLVAGTRDITWYLYAGRATFEQFDGLLRGNGVPFEQSGRILDFGCGVGRLMRYLSDVKGPAIYGSDYNPELIRWCERHVPFASFAVNPLNGPLPYADNFFDLVYAYSVFTHLTEAQQHLWMKELTRVLRPGGHLLFTTHGEAYLPVLNADERQRFTDGKLVIRNPEIAGQNECGAFCSAAYIREKLAPYLEEIDAIRINSGAEMGQDTNLFRKPL